MRRVVAVVVPAVAAVAIVAAPAWAHAELRSSNPAANAQVPSAPSTITLSFTEPPDPGLSTVQVLSSSGSNVAVGPVSVSGTTLTVAVTGAMPTGTYTVNWRAVSRTDGHLTAGSFAFGVGQPAAAPRAGSATSTTPFPSALSVVSKWLLYAGLVLLFAGAVVGFGVLRVRALRPAPIAVAAAAAAAGWIGFVASEASPIGVGAATFLRSDAGRPYVWLGAAVTLGVTLGVAYVATSRPPLAWGASAAAAAAMLVRAIGGHADTGPLPALEVAAQFAHLAAVGIWIGGIAWLLLTLSVIAAFDRPDAVKRFSTVAGVALAVVAATGVVRAVDELGGITHVGRLFSTDYGWTLAAKVAVAVLLIAAGAWNRYVNVPRTANGAEGVRSLRWVLGAEAFLAAGILALTGLLTGLPPAVSAAASTPNAPTALVVNASDFATTVRARLRISPGTVGANRFDLRVVDYDSGRPIDARRVTLRFSPMSNAAVAPSTIGLRRVAPGEWAATASAISIDDRWQIVATIQTATGSTEVPMQVSPRVAGGTVTVSSASGQPTLYTTTFADGSSIQAYVDPGMPGPNQLHATAFGADGKELPLRRVSLIAIDPAGSGTVLQPIRFSAGHYAANLRIEPGSWRFEIRALAAGGAALDARFSQQFTQESPSTT
jgi:copper transport protein